MKKFDKDKYLRKLKFKRLWSKYQRYVYLGVSCLVIAVLCIYFAHSKFTTTSEEEVIRTTVGNFIYGDVIATPYIDGEYSLTFPEKKTGINVEKIVCDNDTSASWDEEKWGLMVTNLSKRTKCSIYFVTPASCGINDNVSCINSREELANLATEVNNGDNKSDKIVYLTSDIDLGGKFDSNGNALDGNISWTPIGTYEKPFSGTFDGNGHILSNMYISKRNSEKNGDGNGLFGNAENGFIKNLGVKSSFVNGYYNQAGIVGTGGMIKNCFSMAKIQGTARTAGICGSGCTVINTFNGGNVLVNSGEDLTGGICGGWCIVSNSYNYGAVSSNGNSVGGISGWFSQIYNSYNFGNVSGTYAGTGGILGQGVSEKNIIKYGFNISILKNNYNAGKISGGGILGFQYEVGSYQNLTMIIKNNYYLEGTASYGLYLYQNNINAEPISKDQMPSIISVINGDNAFVEDTNNINNGYPILKWQTERENS